MRVYTLNNDIDITLRVYDKGKPFDFSKSKVSISLVNLVEFPITDFTITGGTIQFVFKSSQQYRLGNYDLKIVIQTPTNQIQSESHESCSGLYTPQGPTIEQIIEMRRRQLYIYGISCADVQQDEDNQITTLTYVVSNFFQLVTSNSGVCTDEPIIDFRIDLSSNTCEGEDYNNLLNLPTINGKEIKGELTTEDLGLVPYQVHSEEIEPLSEEIDVNISLVCKPFTYYELGYVDSLTLEFEQNNTEACPFYYVSFTTGPNFNLTLPKGYFVTRDSSYKNSNSHLITVIGKVIDIIPLTAI